MLSVKFIERNFFIEVDSFLQFKPKQIIKKKSRKKLRGTSNFSVVSNKYETHEIVWSEASEYFMRVLLLKFIVN